MRPGLQPVAGHIHHRRPASLAPNFCAVDGGDHETIFHAPTRPRVARELTYDERAIALAMRLGIDVPSQSLTSVRWQKLWAGIGKVLLRIDPPEPLTLQALWADIGMYLAELREPEFQWGPGRRPGGKKQTIGTGGDEGGSAQKTATPECRTEQKLGSNFCHALKERS